MPIEFISYQKGLEDFLAILHRAAFSGHKPWSADAFRELLALPINHLCVSYKGHAVSELEGFLIYSAFMDEAEIITFAVAPCLQGQGIGKKIMGSFLHEMKCLGIQSVFLEVAEKNHQAYGLYASYEFKVQAKRMNYYGQGNHAFLMKRLL